MTVAAPLVLTLRKAHATTYPVINQSYLTATNQAAFGLYQGCKGGEPLYSQFWNASVAISNLSQHLSSIGATSYLGPWIPPPINQSGVMTYNANLQNWVHEFAQSGGPNWNFLTSDFFGPNADAQPYASQVAGTGIGVTGPISLKSCLDNYHASLTAFAKSLPGCAQDLRRRNVRMVSTSYVHRGRDFDLLRTGTTPISQQQAEIGIMGGTTAVAGGAALMAASGLTFGTAWAAGAGTAAFLAFTGGIGLVVLGLAIAGYYTYQYCSNSGGTPPAEQIPDNPAVTEHDDPN